MSTRIFKMINNFNKLEDLGPSPGRWSTFILAIKLLGLAILPMKVGRNNMSNWVVDSICKRIEVIRCALKNYDDFKHSMQQAIMEAEPYVTVPTYQDIAPEGRGVVMSSLVRSMLLKLDEQQVLLDVKKSECDNAYTERARLISHLSKCYPSYKAIDKNPSFHTYNTVIYVESDNGQMSWHVSDKDVHLFEHLDDIEEHAVYDGHTTEEKYERLAQCAEDLLDPYFGTIGDVIDCRISTRGEEVVVTDILKTSIMAEYKEGESPEEIFLKHDKHGKVIILQYRLEQQIKEGDDTYTEDIFGDLDSHTEKPFKKKRTKLKIVKND